MTAPRLAPGAAHTLGLAVLGGLLSSSCCVLQLALNALSFGCAGFSALTPYRPLFLAATAGGLGLAHWRSRCGHQPVPHYILACLSQHSQCTIRQVLVKGWPQRRPATAAACTGDRSSAPACCTGRTHCFS
jgi:hypothetical protein